MVNYNKKIENVNAFLRFFKEYIDVRYGIFDKNWVR